MPSLFFGLAMPDNIRILGSFDKHFGKHKANFRQGFGKHFEKHFNLFLMKRGLFMHKLPIKQQKTG